MTGRRSHLPLTALLLLAPLGLAAQSRVEQSRGAEPEGLVEISNGMGSVRVTGWGKPEVLVRADLRHHGQTLQLTGGEGRTRVEVTGAGPHGGQADLEVQLPAGSRVRVEGFQASVDVSGVTGSVRAETVNGHISVAGPLRDVEVQSVNGSVEVTKVRSRTRAEAVNGPVTVREAAGDVDASTVNGPLEVSGGAIARARLETVSGRLRFEGGLTAQARLEAESVSGPVELVLPASVSADFVVSSFSGEIENELGPAATRRSRFTPEKEVRFTTGDGRAKVSLRTLSGRIHLRKQP